MKSGIVFALLTALATQAWAGVEVVCSFAPSQSKAVAAISGAAGGASATLTAVGAATGLTVATHSSGAAILTGSAGYIAGTIGGAAAAPVIVAVGLIVGGAAVSVELVCASKNHPDQVAKVRDASVEFGHRFQETMRNTKVASVGMVKSVRPAAGKAALQVKRVASDVWQYVYRKGSRAS